MATFEEQLNGLLDRTKNIKSPINAATIGTNINEYNRPSEIWVNDVEIFYNQYLQDHPLGSRMKTILFHRSLDAYSQLISCLESIKSDQAFIDKMNGVSMEVAPKYKAKMLPEYDVFISHANADKEALIEELYNSLNKLGVKIFYDKETLEWGDKFKDKILEGTKKSEFVERFPELSLFYRLFSPLNSEMICIFPYFCPYAESAREIRGIFVALHINNWFSEPILI